VGGEVPRGQNLKSTMGRWKKEAKKSVPLDANKITRDFNFIYKSSPGIWFISIFKNELDFS
jgi:hypothetical protein